jgi:hypothetical protein
VSQSREIFIALSLPVLASKLKYSWEYGVPLEAWAMEIKVPDAKKRRFSCSDIPIQFYFCFLCL